jgi:SAM-dependent methyltransferase
MSRLRQGSSLTPERIASIGCVGVTEARGRSFGGVAEDYERGRPGYPERVVEVAGLPRSADVLDLAAGTGKLTRLLALHFDRVVAVEPDDALRALIQGAEALAGTAEQIPLPDGSLDGVFCAEAFHWFNASRAIAEIARVLRPGGTLVVCFNAWSGEKEPAWPEEVDEILRRYGPPDQPVGVRHLIEAGLWREAFAEAPFEELRFETVQNESVLDTEGEISYLLTLSGIAIQPESQREALREELRGFLPRTTWRTPLRTEIWLTRRL